MNTLIDRDKPRLIEVRFRNVTEDGVSLAQAERFQRSACDFLAIIQGFRDVPSDSDGAEISSLVSATIDGKTGAPLGLEDLYNVWLSIAGLIARYDDESVEALRIRRFVSVVLQRVQLDENLQRLESMKALHPNTPEKELVEKMLGGPEDGSTLG
jgi:hypothetical protein